MSDFNPLDRAKIAVHRSSFDLSSKKLFTAKIGEILPFYWQIAIPGTKYRVSQSRYQTLRIGLPVLFLLIPLRIPVLRNIMIFTLCRCV